MLQCPQAWIGKTRPASCVVRPAACNNSSSARGACELGGDHDGFVAYEMCSPLRGGGSMANLDATAEASLDRVKTLMA